MAEEELIVLRCATCGDTFPLHAADEGRCPSCGGSELDPAQEPLL